jgi:hypothetical protein
MGLGHVALAMVQAEAAKTRVGPWVLNCQAPDEGNMHTLVHWANDDQKQRYLKPLCDGTTSSCFAMTEPEVASSDPTLIRTTAINDGDDRRRGNQANMRLDRTAGQDRRVLVAVRPPPALLCSPRLVHVGSLVSDDGRARANGLVDDDAVAVLASRTPRSARGRSRYGARRS